MFKKGQSGNIQGRPIGAKDKTTKDIREKFQLLVENNFTKIQKDFDELTAGERIKFYLDFARFVLPTLKSTEFTEINNTKFQAVEFNIKDLFRVEPYNTPENEN